MIEGEKLTDLMAWDLPYNIKMNLKDVEFESGLHLARLTIREGKRITICNIDAASAKELGFELINWAKTHGG